MIQKLLFLLLICCSYTYNTHGQVTVFSQDFEPVACPQTSNILPPGWTMLGTGGTTGLRINVQTPAPSNPPISNCSYFRLSMSFSTVNADRYLVSPTIALDAGITYTSNFTSRALLSTGSAAILAGTFMLNGSAAIAGATTIAAFSTTNTEGWKAAAPTFTVPTTGNYFLIWRIQSSSNSSSINLYGLDNILITKPGALPANMSHTATVTTQASTEVVGPGSTQNPILRMEVQTTGNIAPLSATGFSFNTTGTTNPTTDLINARLWATAGTAFSAPVALGTAVVSPNGNFNFSGFSRALIEGSNYFWLTYDINPCANYYNQTDAQCTALQLNTGTASPAPAPAAPTGTRMVLGDHIQSFIQNFASSQTCGTSIGLAPSGWTVSSSGTNNRWTFGDIIFPCSGCPGNIMPSQPPALAATGNGFAHLYSFNDFIGPNTCNSPYYSPTQTSTSILTSPFYNTTGMDLVKLSFWFVSDGELNKDFGTVEYSYTGSSWFPLISGTIPARLQGTSSWTQVLSNSEAVLSNQPAVQFRFIWQNDGSGGTGSPLAIDNFRILSAPPTPASLLTWNGSASTDWHTATNWTPAQIPTRCTDVIIASAAQYPIIATGADAACRTLTINPACSLTNNTSNTGSMNIYGNMYLDDEAVLTSNTGGLLKPIELYSTAGTIYIGLDANISTARLALQTGSSYQLSSNLTINSVAIRTGASLQVPASRELTVFGFQQLGSFSLVGASVLRIMGINNGYASLDNVAQTTNPIFSTATLNFSSTSEVHYLGGSLGLNQNIKSITYPLLVVAGGAGATATLGSGTAFVASRLWVYNTDASGIIRQDNDITISGNAFVGTNPSNSANFGQKLNIELNARIIGSGGSWVMGTQNHYLKVNYTHPTNAFVSGFASHVFYGEAELSGVAAVRQRIVSNAVFDTLIINRPANDAELLGNISVMKQLDLQSGNLITSTMDTVRIANFASSAVAFNNASQSCVVGNLRRMTMLNTDYFFPVGSASNRQTAFVNLNSISGGLNQISARFVTTNPTLDAYNGAIGSSGLIGFWDFGANFNALRANGYWNIRPNTGDASYEMRLWPQPLGLSASDFMQLPALGIGANAYTFVRRTASNPTVWQKEGTITNPNIAQMNNGVFADNSLRRTALSGFSNFALVGGFNTTGPLPIELLYFNGRRQDAQTNLLTWQTASEKDNAGFDILAGQNPESLRLVGFMKAKTNYSNPNGYNFKHNTTQDTYYQLVQKDLDNTKNYSPIIFVRADKQSKAVLYPNPASQIVFVDAPIGSEIVVHDGLGRLVFQSRISEPHSGFDFAAKAASGIYMVHVYQDNKLILADKLVIKK